MKTSPEGIRLIKHFEGFRSFPYRCSANVLTIGYGHTQGVSEDMAHITERYACELLEQDLKKFESSVKKLIKIPLKQNEFDALVSFAFNLGAGALQRSTLRQKLNREDRQGAADEFLKWCRAGGKILKGLLRRRIAEREMFLS